MLVISSQIQIYQSQANNNDGINIGYLIIISILANIIFFCMIFIAMFADVIYRNVRHYHTFERIKSYCAIMAVVSFFITLYSSIKLYPEFRDDYIYFHVIILSIFGIIVPLLWMFINNFTKKFGKSSVNWSVGNERSRVITCQRRVNFPHFRRVNFPHL